MSEEWRVEDREGGASTLHARWPSVDHDPGRRAVAVCRPTAPAVVLGSTQPDAVIDAARAVARGITVARRRSGGGAVLVTPADPVWIDVWVPAGDRLWNEDVARAFDWLGDAWVNALLGCRIRGVSAHRGGPFPCTRWSSLVCFGGVSTGEVVTDQGRKVVGLSQRRTRMGAWFHTACVLHWEPMGLVGLLALPESERIAAGAGLEAAVAGAWDVLTAQGDPPVDGRDIAASLAASLP